MKNPEISRSIALVVGLSMALVVVDVMAQGQGQGQNRRTQQQQQQPQRGRGVEESALKTGQLAPTFTLQSLDGKETFDLREHRGERPVVLIFGSYT